MKKLGSCCLWPNTLCNALSPFRPSLLFPFLLFSLFTSLLLIQNPTDISQLTDKNKVCSTVNSLIVMFIVFVCIFFLVTEIATKQQSEKGKT